MNPNENEQHKLKVSYRMIQKNFSIMLAMQRKNEFCDVNIKVGDKVFVAHGVILAAAIPYFRSIFAKKEKSKYIIVHGIESSTFKILLYYAYNKEVVINEKNVRSLFIGSSLLLLNEVRNACVEFLISTLDARNVFEIKELATSINCSTLCSVTENYICCYFLEISQSREFLTLNLEELIRIISLDDLQVVSEEIVFNACLSWVKLSPEMRKAYLPKIFLHVRLSLLSLECLCFRVAKDPLIALSFQCRNIVDEVHCLHVVPNYKSEVFNLITRPRNKRFGKIYVIGGEHNAKPLKSVEFYDPIKKKWKFAENLPFPMSYINAAVFDSKLYTFGKFNGLDYKTKVLVLDPRENKWSQKKEMVKKRHFAASEVFDNFIYLFGGKNENDEVNRDECYDPSTDTWTTVSSLTVYRNWFCVVALNRYLYAIGGKDNQDIVCKTVKKYSFDNKFWAPVKDILTERYSFGAAILKGYIYICGGKDQSETTLNSVEVYDPSTNVWKSVSPMNCKRYAFSVIALNEMLWAIGGANEHDNYLSSVEVYKPDQDVWSFVNPLNEVKSDFGVAVLFN